MSTTGRCCPRSGAWLIGWLGLGCGADPASSTAPSPTPPAAGSLSLTPRWVGEADQPFAGFGNSVASAGDVDGDAYDDVLVGALYFDGAGVDGGRAHLFRGSPEGLSTTPAWTADGAQDVVWLGASVAGAGDVNGDGFADVLVGAPRHDQQVYDDGLALLYLGSSSGLSTATAWTFTSGQLEAGLGNWVAGAGDVNGDGFADVLVAGSHSDGGQANEGRVLLFLGGSAGLGPVPAWSTESDQAQAYYGGAASTAGDVNGDGFHDLVVGAPLYDDGELDEGRAYLYLGGPSGPLTTPDWTAASDQVSAYLGVAAGTAGDVDGDGFADVLLGVPDYDDGEIGEGQVRVYRGAASGPDADPFWVASSNVALADFGSTAASAGDVDGDGHDDVFVGAGQYDHVYLFLGAPGGPAAEPSWIGGAEASDFPDDGSVPTERDIEYSVASAGDVDGNGLDDLVFGAAYATHGEEQEGRAYLFTSGD